MSELGFNIKFSELPIVIKIGMVFWIVAILCFVVMVASAITPFFNYPATILLKVAYAGGFSFIIGILLMVLGLPKTTNHKR